MSRSGRPALRLRGCGGPGPLGIAANIVLTDNRIIRLEGQIYNNNLSIQFNLIVFT